MKDGVVRTGYPASQVAVIPNSSDIKMFRVNESLGREFRAKREWIGENPLIIYTGTFGLINGVGYMIDLAVELDKLQSDIRILLIGHGIEFSKVKSRAENMGVLGRNVFIEESLPKNEMPAALSAATISSSLFIDKPEMRPNSANKFFDALAAGKPVLINYGGWMHDLIESKGCGLAMWRQPLSTVAKKLDENLNNSEWCESASTASKELAEQYFDRDALANELLSVILETAKGKPDKAESIAPGAYG